MTLERSRRLINGVWQYVTAPDGGGGPGSTPNLATVLAEGADAGGAGITGLDDPTADQDAATKKYVDDNGGSQPYRGQPKSDGGDTYNGVPGVSDSAEWQTFYMGVFPSPANVVWYAIGPSLSRDITLTSLEIQIEDGLLTDVNVRVAVSLGDVEWQPVGDVLYEGTLVVPGGSSPADTFSLTGLSALIPSQDEGVVIYALEMDDDNLLFQCRPGSWEGYLHCDGSNPPTSPDDVVIGFTAPHVYAPFAGPLPRWTLPVNGSNISLRRIPYPFVMKWT